MNKQLFSFLATAAAFSTIAAPAIAETRDMIFPVIGSVSYSDDFGAPRSGHTHEGNDLLGQKLLKLVATVDGTVRFVAYPEPSYGYYITIEDAAGYRYNYLHINNDNPGTDDGNGGGMHAYAPYMYSGAQVKAGQLVGWMGDSGNAESTTPHLHFEIRDTNNTPFSPYDSLQAAEHIDTEVAAPQADNEMLPYGEFTGGANIALGQFDDDAKLEIVTGAGEGGGPLVRVFNQNETYQHTFFAFSEDYHGGIDVASGDLNGDGIDEIIVGAGIDHKPRVRIYRADGEFVRGFLAYDETFTGGIHVAAADLDGDGRAEIITGPKAGGGPQVRTFTRKGKALNSFFAFNSSFRGGIDVTARPQTEEQNARIVVSMGSGSSPLVGVFTSAGYEVRTFTAYDDTFTGGIRVSMGNVDDSTNATEVVTVPESDGSGDVRTFSLDGTQIGTESAFEEWWVGGYDIGVGESKAFIASGPEGRRASVRELDEAGSGNGGYGNGYGSDSND